MSNLTNIVYPNQESPLNGLGEQCVWQLQTLIRIFPGDSDGKESACNAGDLALIPGLTIYPGERNGNSLQYSCLDNPMDRRAWRS